jgi:thymidine phosphorylase
MLAKPGDRVTAGAPLLRLHTDEPARIERALAALAGAVTVGAAGPAAGDLVLDRMAAD